MSGSSGIASVYIQPLDYSCSHVVGSRDDMSSHKRMKPVGDQELALLHFLGDCGQASVGEAAERFGQPRGLARSTVLTMMERLRQKGHLARRQVNGLYRYSPKTA